MLSEEDLRGSPQALQALLSAPGGAGQAAALLAGGKPFPALWAADARAARELLLGGHCELRALLAVAKPAQALPLVLPPPWPACTIAGPVRCACGRATQQVFASDMLFERCVPLCERCRVPGRLAWRVGEGFVPLPAPLAPALAVLPRQCCICLEEVARLRTNFYQCRNGHGACAECFFRLPRPMTCPVCRLQEPWKKIGDILNLQTACQVCGSDSCNSLGCAASHACCPLCKTGIERQLLTHHLFGSGCHPELLKRGNRAALPVTVQHLRQAQRTVVFQGVWPLVLGRLLVVVDRLQLRGGRLQFRVSFSSSEAQRHDRDCLVRVRLVEVDEADETKESLLGCCVRAMPPFVAETSNLGMVMMDVCAAGTGVSSDAPELRNQLAVCVELLRP